MMLPCKIIACNLLAVDDELSFAKSFHAIDLLQFPNVAIFLGPSW